MYHDCVFLAYALFRSGEYFVHCIWVTGNGPRTCYTLHVLRFILFTA
jgi:hypothetical protein